MMKTGELKCKQMYNPPPVIMQITAPEENQLVITFLHLET